MFSALFGLLKLVNWISLDCWFLKTSPLAFGEHFSRVFWHFTDQTTSQLIEKIIVSVTCSKTKKTWAVFDLFISLSARKQDTLFPKKCWTILLTFPQRAVERLFGLALCARRVEFKCLNDAPGKFNQSSVQSFNLFFCHNCTYAFCRDTVHTLELLGVFVSIIIKQQ